MFALLRRSPWVAKVISVAFIMPLMFAGGSFLSSVAVEQNVGAVGSFNIPRQEFIERYQRAAEEYRRQNALGAELPPPARRGVIQQVQHDLLSKYLLSATLKEKGVHAPDSAIARAIRRNPEFQDDSGEFSYEHYQRFVRNHRYYKQQIGDFLNREPLLRAMTEIPVQPVRERLAAFRQQQRTIAAAVLPLDSFAAVSVTLTIDDINLYYQENINDYRTEETMFAEYILVSLDLLADDETVSDEEIQLAYEDYIAEQEIFERWEVAHIYVTEQARADELYEQARAAPETFADIARQSSQDPGSADAGGALGIVLDGDLPDALNDALLTMNAGEIHPPVEVDGGYSILKLDDIIAAELPELADIKDDIVRRARRDKAAPEFNEKIEDWREQAHIDIGSLADLATAIGAPLQFRATVYRDAAANAFPFDDGGVIAEAFDPTIVATGENSAPIPVGEDAYMFLRARQYQPPGVRPVATVEAEIRERLVADHIIAGLYRSLYIANDDTTAALTKELDELSWDAQRTFAVADAPDDLPDSWDDRAIDRIFSADLSRGLPAYIFLPGDNAIQIYRISDVNEAAATETDYQIIGDMSDNLSNHLAGVGYLDALTQRYNFQFDDLAEIEGLITGAGLGAPPPH